MLEYVYGEVVIVAHVSIKIFMRMVSVLLFMSDEYSQAKQERRASKFNWTHGNVWTCLGKIGVLSLVNHLSWFLWAKGYTNNTAAKVLGFHEWQIVPISSQAVYGHLDRFVHPPIFTSLVRIVNMVPVSKNALNQVCRSVKASSGQSPRCSFVYKCNSWKHVRCILVSSKEIPEKNAKVKIANGRGPGYVGRVSATRAMYSHCFLTYWSMISSSRASPER